MNPWKFWQSVFQSMEKFHSENSEKFVANICACFDWISETFCVIWCHLYNFKNVKNTHRRVLLLVKLQAHYLLSPPLKSSEFQGNRSKWACNFTKSNIPPWVFFMFFKLYKRYQIAQGITNYFSYNYFLPNSSPAPIQPKHLGPVFLSHLKKHEGCYMVSFTCSKLTTETLEQCVKSIQS